MKFVIRLLVILVLGLSALGAIAEVQVINGRKYECADGVCRLVEDADKAEAPKPAAAAATETAPAQAPAKATKCKKKSKA